MEKLKLALDWTPNINHIGFFVARELGFYSELGLALEISSPATDEYQLTPAKKVELGQADFALCPMESVLSYRTKDNAFDLKAIAAIFKEDLSAIVTMKNSGISFPGLLDGKSYASYQARYEDEIVKQMIINDGGKGDIEVIYPPKLGIWETIVNGDFDATWIFMNWEGVQAKSKGLELNTFKMSDYKVPYSYSPVIAASEKQISARLDAYRKFLNATKRGFLAALEAPEQAASILSSEVAATDQDIDLLLAIDSSKKALGDQASWGIMDSGNVQEYLDWIYQHQLEQRKVSVEDLVTNKLLA